jgi:CheY-like chemotaxis protein
MSNEKKSTVLLIEPDPVLRRLIVLGLEHRGMRVIEATSAAHLASFEAQTLDLLVLDLDGSAGHQRSFLTDAHALLAHPQFSALPTILLAWEYPASINATQSTIATVSPIKYLTKPFDARVLHESINQFLLAQAAEEAAREARAEALLLATYEKHTSPSIWPVVTAAGLLLAFIGMMLQITVTIVGILIVIVALLWWTLEKKPASEKVALRLVE